MRFFFSIRIKGKKLNERNEIFVIQQSDFSPVEIDFFLFLAERECRAQLLSKIATL